MTVNEAAIALNLNGTEVVYRLLAVGVLKGTKEGRLWNVDEASVEDRKRKVALKKSSKLNATAERERERVAARGLFA